MNCFTEEQKERIADLVKEIEKLSNVEKLFLYLQLPCGRAEGGEEPPAIGKSKLNGTKLNSDLFSKKPDQETTQTYTWILSHLEVDPNVSLPKQEVYDEYRAFCQANRFEPLCVADFGKAMKHAFPCIKPRRLGQRGNSRYCYSGLRKKYKIQPPNLPDIIDPSTICASSDSNCSEAFSQATARAECCDNLTASDGSHSINITTQQPTTPNSYAANEVMNLKIDQTNNHQHNHHHHPSHPHHHHHQQQQQQQHHQQQLYQSNGTCVDFNAPGKQRQRQYQQQTTTTIGPQPVNKVSQFEACNRQPQLQRHPRPQGSNPMTSESVQMVLGLNDSYSQEQLMRPADQHHNPHHPPMPQQQQQQHHNHNPVGSSNLQQPLTRCDFGSNTIRPPGTPDDDDYHHNYQDLLPMNGHLPFTPSTALIQQQQQSQIVPTSGSGCMYQQQQQQSTCLAPKGNTCGASAAPGPGQQQAPLSIADPSCQATGTNTDQPFNQSVAPNPSSPFGGQATDQLMSAVSSNGNDQQSHHQHQHLSYLNGLHIESCASPFQSPRSTPYPSVMGNGYMMQDMIQDCYPNDCVRF